MILSQSAWSTEWEVQSARPADPRRPLFEKRSISVRGPVADLSRNCSLWVTGGLMMPGARVVVINGVGSVGKTSTARALQEISAGPLLHVAMDRFIEMAPPRLFGAAEGMRFETGVDAGGSSVAISTGSTFERLMSGMRHAIAAMAEQGNDLIVDDVFWNGEDQEYRRLLQCHQVSLVGLFAPLDLIEARERMRGDRAVGLARWQYDRVHQGVLYDLEIDMATITASEAATVIRDAFDL